MATSIKRHFTHLPSQEEIEMKRILNATQADLAALHASFLLLTAKLDGDTGITDINYATVTNPATQELTT